MRSNPSARVPGQFEGAPNRSLAQGNRGAASRLISSSVWTRSLRSGTRRHGHVSFLCARRPFRGLRPRVWGGQFGGVSLCLPARRVAVRCCGTGLVRGGVTVLVATTEPVKASHEPQRYIDPLPARVSGGWKRSRVL